MKSVGNLSSKGHRNFPGGLKTEFSGGYSLPVFLPLTYLNKTLLIYERSSARKRFSRNSQIVTPYFSNSAGQIMSQGTRLPGDEGVPVSGDVVHHGVLTAVDNEGLDQRQQLARLERLVVCLEEMLEHPAGTDKWRHSVPAARKYIPLEKVVHIWSYMAPYMTIYDHIWKHKWAHIWPYMVSIYDHIRSYMVHHM